MTSKEEIVTQELSIDELIRDDEERIKAKKKRLNNFAKALQEAREANDRAAAAAQDILDNGDVNRREFGQVFKLSRAERSSFFPATRKAPSAEPSADAVDNEAHQGVENFN